MYRPFVLVVFLLLGSSQASSFFPFESNEMLMEPLDAGPMVPRAWMRNAPETDNLVEQEPLDLPVEDLGLTAEMNETLALFDNANCGVKNGPNFGLIVGGQESSPNAWPWAIGLIRYGSFICGGSILSERYILTAAHCVSKSRQTQPASALQVMVGAHNLGNSGQLYPVERVIPHQQYDENYMQNDIAILKLRTPINFAQLGNKARPICLPSAAMDSKNYVGKMSTVVGWGTTREGGQISRTLQQVQIPIISNQQCSQQYNPVNIRAGQICASYPRGGKDSCQGDSGGSLTMPENGKYYQLGVVSWGSGCARPGAPGVYTRVTKHLSWIAQNTR